MEAIGVAISGAMMNSNDGEQHAHENPRKINEDHHGPGVAYRLAEFGLYSIFLIGDVFEFWGEHRIFALTVAVAGLGFLLVIDRGFSLRTVARVVIGAAFLAVISYFLIPEAHTPVVQTVPAAPSAAPIARPSPEIGWLQPGTEPTPSNPCDTEPTTDKDSVLILAGGNAFRAIAPLNQFAAVAVGWCPLLLQKTENGLALSTTIFDRDGAELGSIVNNKFKVTMERGLVTERSGDLTTLVVHDSKDAELLYVRYLNPKAIRVRGIFSCPQPRLRTVVITDRAIQGGFVQNSCFGGGGSGTGIYFQ